MTGRNLTTTRKQVFGDVDKGSECRICGRPVTDNRSKTCSDYCGNIQSAVMSLLNWSSLRRLVLDRDDQTCQQCGYDQRRERRARDHIRARIDAKCGPRPESPSLETVQNGADIDWDRHLTATDAWREWRERMKARYGDPYDRQRDLEVDHIQPVADGGHPFDPGNLQTLCDQCHEDKTTRENSERGRTPSAAELNESLFDYIDGDDTKVSVDVDDQPEFTSDVIQDD